MRNQPINHLGRPMLRTLLLATLCAIAACDRSRSSTAGATDSAFKAVQERGAEVMGVDQYTSHHVFEDLPDGGRVVLARDDASDSIAVAIIRAHLRAIADSFSRGIFTDPSRVHAREVPGTSPMARLRGKISYDMVDRPGGGEVRITSSDPEAIAAIHEFLAFQRMDHHAAGHAM